MLWFFWKVIKTYDAPPSSALPPPLYSFAFNKKLCVHFVVFHLLQWGLNLCAECNNVCVCVRDRERERDARMFYCKDSCSSRTWIFLVHLVSSFLSPLSLSRSPSLAFSTLKGGWGRGGGQGWKGRGSGGGGGNCHGYNATTNIHQVDKVQTNGSAL